MRRGVLQLAAIAALALGRAASAQAPAEAKAAPAVSPSSPAVEAPAARVAQPSDAAAATKADRPVRIRASHRVDVIAPHERVETIIDRMRNRGPTPALRDAKPTDRLPARAPEVQTAPSHNTGDRGRGRDLQRPNTPAAPPAERR